MTTKLEKYYRSIPKIYKPGTNPAITALLKGFAGVDEEIATQIDNTKAQLFVRTATQSNLDVLASSRGVKRPLNIGLSDTDFQELIPNLSFKAKQIRSIFYDVADVFWGPLFSRANVESTNFETWNISVGETFKVKIDGGTAQEIKVVAADITSGATTAAQLIIFFSKITGMTAESVTDNLTSNVTLNLRTNTPGPRGSIEIDSTSTMVGASKLAISTSKIEIIQQDQRVQIFEINPNEMVVEIPVVVPSLRRELEGSHHFHADSTIVADWPGGFLYDPSGIRPFTITGQNAIIQTQVDKGAVAVSITVDDSSPLLENTGNLVFGYGTDNEEAPVKFRGVPNSNTILIDPAHVFQFTHAVGTYVNVISGLQTYTQNKDGSDYGIYFTSPTNARAIIETILRDLAAAGVVVNFIILAPEFKYTIDNPYISSDDAP